MPTLSRWSARPAAIGSEGSKRAGQMHQTSAPQGVFKAAGGAHIYLAVLPSEWPRLLRAMEMPQLAEDERFKTDRARLKNNLVLRDLIEGWMESLGTVEAVLARLDEQRVPCAPVLKVAEAMEHPHIRQRGTVRKATDPAFGEFDIPGMPVQFSDWPARTGVKASKLGQDNETVLRDLLGMTGDAIAKLYAEGILIRDQSLENNAA